MGGTGETLSAAWLCQKNVKNKFVPEETDITTLYNDFYNFILSSVCRVIASFLSGEHLPGPAWTQRGPSLRDKRKSR